MYEQDWERAHLIGPLTNIVNTNLVLSLIEANNGFVLTPMFEKIKVKNTITSYIKLLAKMKLVRIQHKKGEKRKHCVITELGKEVNSILAKMIENIILSVNKPLDVPKKPSTEPFKTYYRFLTLVCWLEPFKNNTVWMLWKKTKMTYQYDYVYATVKQMDVMGLVITEKFGRRRYVTISNLGKKYLKTFGKIYRRG